MSVFFRSMAGRVFAILVAGITLSTLIMYTLAERERRAMVEQFLLERGVERVSQAVVRLEHLAPSARATFADEVRPFGMNISLAANATIVGERDSQFEQELTRVLKNKAGLEVRVQARATCMAEIDARDRHKSLESKPEDNWHCRVIQTVLRDGTAVQIGINTPKPFRIRARHPGPWAIALFLSLLGVLAYLVARISTKPLRELANAAVRLGEQLDRPPLTVTGPLEVQRATSAFNVMQSRIRSFVDDRTHMLGAITHDLQTPLTRLRLRLEKVTDPELYAKLVDDLGHMQHTIREGLELVRSLGTTEPARLIDLDSLLDSVCSDACDMGADVSLNGRLGFPIKGRLNALRRCLTNLIDNAVKYGGYARIIVMQSKQQIVITITDGGSGIPQAKLEKVFLPFYRLEDSRSRDTGGTGLGLTIARNLAEQQGGNLRLRNLSPYGLEASVTLPIVT